MVLVPVNEACWEESLGSIVNDKYDKVTAYLSACIPLSVKKIDQLIYLRLQL